MNDLPRFLIAALVVIRHGETILLVQQNIGKQCWGLPGGLMEPGESIEQTAVREVREETGLDIRVTRVVGLYSVPGEGALSVTFAGEVIGGTMRQVTHETAACRYFPFDHLPEHMPDYHRDRIEDFRLNLPTVLRTQ